MDHPGGRGGGYDGGKGSALLEAAKGGGGLWERGDMEGVVGEGGQALPDCASAGRAARPASMQCSRGRARGSASVGRSYG